MVAFQCKLNGFVYSNFSLLRLFLIWKDLLQFGKIPLQFGKACSNYEGLLWFEQVPHQYGTPMQRDSVPSWKKLTSIWKDFGGKFVIRKETRSLPPPFNFTSGCSIAPWDRPLTNSATFNNSGGKIVQCKLQKDDAFPLCKKNAMKSFIWSTNICFYNLLAVTSINNMKKDHRYKRKLFQFKKFPP